MKKTNHVYLFFALTFLTSAVLKTSFFATTALRKSSQAQACKLASLERDYAKCSPWVKQIVDELGSIKDAFQDGRYANLIKADADVNRLYRDIKGLESHRVSHGLTKKQAHKLSMLYTDEHRVTKWRNLCIDIINGVW